MHDFQHIDVVYLFILLGRDIFSDILTLSFVHLYVYIFTTSEFACKFSFSSLCI